MVASQTQTSEMLPQIVSITPLRDDGSFVLKKVVRDHLGLRPGHALGVRPGDEVWLTASPDIAIPELAGQAAKLRLKYSVAGNCGHPSRGACAMATI